MPSTITTGAGTRLPHHDLDLLRERARREQMTVSALIARMVHEGLHAA
jgi:predicted DNA-binding ribbon-helix-helix protein